ncbi:MAG: type II toxin-antitoxin system RelE/ParE family toxin [Elusimicrobiota bacterium]
MRFNIRFSHLALLDLEAIIEYYSNLRPKMASKYYHGILKAVVRLRTFPSIGRIVPEFEEEYINKYREIIFENYRIIYRIEGTTNSIVRIIDSRRLLTLDFIKTVR